MSGYECKVVYNNNKAFIYTQYIKITAELMWSCT